MTIPIVCITDVLGGMLAEADAETEVAFEAYIDYWGKQAICV